MRTTVTLDPDTADMIRRLMNERDLSFKEAINQAIRAGLAKPTEGRGFETKTAPMGSPRVALDRALSLAGEIEDEELVRKARVGK